MSDDMAKLFDEGMNCAKRIQQLLTQAKRQYEPKKRRGPGRPEGSGNFADAAQFVSALIAAALRLRDEGTPLSQPTIIRYLPSGIDERALRRWFEKFGLSWNNFKKAAEILFK